MLTIPQVRIQLNALADQLAADNQTTRARWLRGLVSNMFRRPCVRKAANESTPMTPALARRIKNFARENPKASYIRIAKRYRVSTGRVSEAIAGKRAA